MLLKSLVIKLSRLLNTFNDALSTGRSSLLDNKLPMYRVPLIALVVAPSGVVAKAALNRPD